MSVLGLLTPFLLPLKLFVQKLVDVGLEWDEELSLELNEEFMICLVDLKKVEKLSIQCCYRSPNLGNVVHIGLHVFGDGSMTSYGSTTYLRFEDESGEVECSLVYAKNRLTPTKMTMSVP